MQDHRWLWGQPSCLRPAPAKGARCGAVRRVPNCGAEGSSGGAVTEERTDSSSVLSRGCVLPYCAVDGLADEDGSLKQKAPAIGILQSGNEAIRIVRCNEIDGATAKAAACKTRPKAAWKRERLLDEKVDLFDGALEVIALADVRLSHQPTKFDRITGEHRFARSTDAAILRNDMTAAAETFGRDFGLTD